MALLETNIDSDDLKGNYTAAISAVFENAPKSHLFITGYPRFWNEETDDCDKVSFKFACNSNAVLPLIKRRRTKMNQLTFRLNDKIKSFIADYQKDHKDVSPIAFVDTDPYFKNHRFCEEGVKEPSYRNPDIWFFPFEYTANNKVMFTVNDETPKGDCRAVSNDGGDAGRYFQCLIANSLADGGEIDLQAQPNNVKSDSDPDLADSKNLPEFAMRIFHPTIKGHAAYKDAFFDTYKAYKDNKAPESQPKSGVKCRGLQDNNYATRAPISDLITNTYCPKLAGMSDSIGTGHYLSNTPEAVEIFAGPSLSGAEGAPTPEQCAKNLHKILDECDTDSNSNPMNWKAGGEVEVDGWTYSITTKKPRPQAPKRPSAWCQLENCKSKKGCTARLWGAGWLSSGFGHGLREGFEIQQYIWSKPSNIETLRGHSGVDVSTWGESFRYEAIDKHEWTVTLQVDMGPNVSAAELVLNTMRVMASPDPKAKDPNKKFLDVGNCVEV